MFILDTFAGARHSIKGKKGNQKFGQRLPPAIDRHDCSMRERIVAMTRQQTKE